MPSAVKLCPAGLLNVHLVSRGSVHKARNSFFKGKLAKLASWPSSVVTNAP